MIQVSRCATTCCAVATMVFLLSAAPMGLAASSAATETPTLAAVANPGHASATKPKKTVRKTNTPNQTSKPVTRKPVAKKTTKKPTKRVSLRGDDAVRAAHAAYERGDVAAFAFLNAKGHLLEPYVAYWALLTRIEKAKDLTPIEKDLNAFFRRWKDLAFLKTPLLIAWQKALGRRDDWARFAKNDPLPEQDLELACYSIQARFPSRPKDMRVAVRQVWRNVVTPPRSCLDLFAQVRADLTVDDIKARVKLLTERGRFPQARSVLRMLPETERVDNKTLALIEKQPLHYLTQMPNPRQTGAREAMFLALEQAANSDVDKAHLIWVTVRNAWPDADQVYGNLRIAVRAARQRNENTLSYFAEVPGNTPLTATQRTEIIRAALRAERYDLALAQIDRLPSAEQHFESWRYWRARCLEKQPSGKAEAQKIYTELGRDLNYYGLLSLERLGLQTIPFPSQPPKINDAQVQAFINRPAVRRMVMLNSFGWRPEMLREWRQLSSTLDRNSLLVAAQALSELGLTDRSIAAVERTPFQHPLPDELLASLPLPEVTPIPDEQWQNIATSEAIDAELVGSKRAPGPILPPNAVPASATPEKQPYNDLALRFPRPFNASFRQAADTFAVDENLLYSIARQESRFVPHIHSSAGASGLMQLMPTTARWVARRIPISGFRVAQLSDPSTNVTLGAYYLRYCLTEFRESVALAAAAYNAGPQRARRWQGWLPLPGDIWVELIPFEETRDYVKKILVNHKIYALQNKQHFSLLDSLNLPTAADSVVTSAGTQE